jgi:SAM-dependent methyltransferase
VLLRRDAPAWYDEWNRRWGAPYGRPLTRAVPHKLRSLPGLAQLVGPFGFQPNSDTRLLEYPWVYEALELSPGMRVLEIGGSNSGFQFVLDRAGCSVVNVDPGKAARGVGWPVTPEFTAKLNRRFDAGVELRNCFIEDAKLADDSFDRALSISTIEHIPRTEIPGILEHVRRVLKPGGRFVITVDLFLDLAPFTDVTENRWGTNVEIRWLVEQSGLELVVGTPEELFGYAEFDAKRVDGLRERFYVATAWPVMVQALVLRKPEA